ncbi:hypothetical protein HAX54_001274, partial [Datura stramonium]|nr:hypothetical protein [Datura stramonium]
MADVSGSAATDDGNQKWVLSENSGVIFHYFQNVREQGLKAVSSSVQRIDTLRRVSLSLAPVDKLGLDYGGNGMIRLK